MNIAMWSGPRNLSTALMYAFAARGDCAVWDEPFYAAYLARTGLAHPMRDEIIAAGETDPTRVAAACVAPTSSDKPLFYQKHMCQHMIADMPRDWIEDVTNVFLIRHPARVMASFASKYEAAELSDIGFVQQAELFDRISETSKIIPIVIDSNDIRKNPEAILRLLCDRLDIAFMQSMLGWPTGPKPYDGVWAPVWYHAVHRSSGFAGQEGPLPHLQGDFARTAKAAMPYYERLRAHALTPSS